MQKNFRILIAICMALLLVVSFSGCKAKTENTTETSVDSLEGSVDSENVREETDASEGTPSESDEETPSEPSETQPSESEPEPVDPSVDEDGYKIVNETVYANTSVNVRSQPNTDCDIVGGLGEGESIHRIGIGDNGWSKVEYGGEVRYIKTEYLGYGNGQEEEPEQQVVNLEYPLTYSDDSATITITREWYESAWCYIAHLEFSNYSRFATDCANGSYNHGTETTSGASERLGAILCVNGDYSAPNLNYPVARNGVVWNDGKCYAPASYNHNNGILYWTGEGSESQGTLLSDMVTNGVVTDTMTFGPAFLVDGQLKTKNSDSRAQRTFIGTTGKAGDIYLVVSDGRYNDGESAGLTAYQCATLLQSKGCTFGVPLDGGGSSTMVFNGVVLNAARGNERAVVDFVYFR